MRIRALTAGLSIFREDLTLGGIGLSNKLSILRTQLDNIAENLQSEGYEVQTRRVAFNTFEEWISPDTPPAEIDCAMKMLVQLLELNHIDFCSLGGCTSSWALKLTPHLLGYSPKLSSSFRIDNHNTSVPRFTQCQDAAAIVLELSQRETTGAANFNFCVAFNSPANIPFFPVSYHISSSPTTLTIGLECGDLLFLAFHGVNAQHADALDNLKNVLFQAFSPVETLVKTSCTTNGLIYGGLDASMNPGLLMQESVGAGIENLIPHRFGAPGTLAAVATITTGIKALKEPPYSLQLTGYSGLMLPVMEDLVLAARASNALRLITKYSLIEGFVGESPPTFTLRDLLFYSAVCGVGLDMVPVPGDITVDALAAIYLEVGTLSNKLSNKPLSARILPIPGKAAGQRTEIQSEYLCNTNIFTV